MSNDATGHGEDVPMGEVAIDTGRAFAGVDSWPFPEADQAVGARSHETWPYSASGEPCHAA